MGNSYFQFKQFTVNQEKSAMKVCTDACVFGAYIASKEKDITDDKTNILDIGTGTGLLSLMVAQKIKGNIDAVEIDNNAWEQAHENFRNSAWQTRLSVFHSDIAEFESYKKYDIIISNPPFCEKSLKSDNDQKNLAKHNASLSYALLASIVFESLGSKGKFYILLPFAEFTTFEKIARQNNLSVLDKMNIRQSKSSDYFRSIGVFTNTTVQTGNTETLAIKDDNEEYSSGFTELLKDYYLYL